MFRYFFYSANSVYHLPTHPVQLIIFWDSTKFFRAFTSTSPTSDASAEETRGVSLRGWVISLSNHYTQMTGETGLWIRDWTPTLPFHTSHPENSHPWKLLPRQFPHQKFEISWVSSRGNLYGWEFSYWEFPGEQSGRNCPGWVGAAGKSGN